jgi:predicted membrane channel-forming protein YqfA (hemolysin III family)
MSVAVIFLIVASIAPFVFFHLKKTVLGVLQIVLLIGMWLYFFEVVRGGSPSVFSVLWLTFYGSLVISEIALVMLAIHVGNSRKTPRKTRSKSIMDN